MNNSSSSSQKLSSNSPLLAKAYQAGGKNCSLRCFGCGPLAQLDKQTTSFHLPHLQDPGQGAKVDIAIRNEIHQCAHIPSSPAIFWNSLMNFFNFFPGEHPANAIKKLFYPHNNCPGASTSSRTISSHFESFGSASLKTHQHFVGGRYISRRIIAPTFFHPAAVFHYFFYFACSILFILVFKLFFCLSNDGQDSHLP